MKTYFNHKLLCLLSILHFGLNGTGQTTDEDKGKLPVKSTFGTGTIIESRTIVQPVDGAIEMNIQHRFSTMQNGIHDFFGIYAAANTRIALCYGINDKIAVGLGTTMYNKLQDLNWKVSLIKQNRSGTIPMSVSYFGNIVLDARDEDFFPPKESYRVIHRFSYFTEIIMARKVSDKLSLQVAPQFAYFNAVDTLHFNYNLGLTIGGRYMIFDSKSIIFDFTQPFTSGDQKPSPNLSLGLEIGTATHAFQVFLTNYQGIIGQHNLVYNSHDPFSGNFTENFNFGFNITIRF